MVTGAPLQAALRRSLGLQGKVLNRPHERAFRLTTCALQGWRRGWWSPDSRRRGEIPTTQREEDDALSFQERAY